MSFEVRSFYSLKPPHSQTPTFPAARRLWRRAAGNVGRLVDLRNILSDKTLAHARQAGVGPLLKKDVWYTEPVGARGTWDSCFPLGPKDSQISNPVDSAGVLR